MSAVVPLAAGVALWLVPQGLEAMRVFGEDLRSLDHTPARFWPVLIFFVTTAIAGGTAWYCARVTLYLFAPDAPSGSPAERRAARELPRIWGMLPPINAALAFILLAFHSHDRTDRWYQFMLALAALVVAVGSYLFFVARRYVIEHQLHLPAPNFGNAQPTLQGLPWYTWAPLVCIALVWVILCLWIVATYADHLVAFTSPGVVMLSVGSWITALTWIHYMGARRRLPLLRLLVLAVVVFAAFNVNDNHAVRRLWGPSSAPRRVGRPLAAPDAFRSWMANRPDRARYGNQYPVFIIAAEGGGIRAAHAAGLVLAGLADLCPAFATHTFAISGVSGGSVGGTAFAILAGRNAAPAAGPPCRAPADRVLALTDTIGAFLDNDFLTPTLAAGLYPDLVTRFLPFKWKRADRARALEIAFERGWDRAVGEGDRRGRDSGFRGSFYSAWTPASRAPALVLNTTRVETGEPILVSQIEPAGEGFGRTASLARIDSTLDLRLSTAATLSARFPLVTPEGKVASEAPSDSVPSVVRLVDGGYFDPSGIATAKELARVIARDTVDAVVPIVIRIGFLVRPVGVRTAHWGTQSRAEPWAEALAPIRAALNARDAHTAEAIQALEAGRSIEAHEFILWQDSVTFILGWQMSEAAHQAAIAKLRAPNDCAVVASAPRPVQANADSVTTRQSNDAEYCAVRRLLMGQETTGHANTR